MSTAYLWLKFLHVASVAVWFGGFAAFSVLNLLVSREPGPAGVKAFLRNGEGLGARLAGPASGLALLTGIGTMITGHTGMPRWITWGLVVMVLFILVGVLGMRPLLRRLRAAVESGQTDALPRLLRSQRRLIFLNLLLLLTALWAMVFKPV